MYVCMMMMMMRMMMRMMRIMIVVMIVTMFIFFSRLHQRSLRYHPASYRGKRPWGGGKRPHSHVHASHFNPLCHCCRVCIGIDMARLL